MWSGEMCCVSCIAIPVFIWIWFNLMMPVIDKVKAIFYPKEAIPDEDSNKDEDITKATNTEDIPANNSEEKKDL